MRVHSRPRKSLFIPTGTKDGPNINDLDRKMASMRFNVDQLNVGRDAFVNMLTESLEQQATE